MNFDIDLMAFLKQDDAYDILESLGVIIKQDNDLTLLKYHQFETPRNHLTNQCRGTIVNDERIVCRGFYRFFNYGEEEASVIDWDTAVVQEKLDGSLIRFFFYHGWWHIATNGIIDAHDADMEGVKYNNFYDLVNDYLESNNLWDELQKFDPDYTYLFELTSPYNRVVVPYKNTTLTFITRIHNETGKEAGNHTNFQSVKEYHIGKDECFKKVDEMPYSEEGYVVKDGNNNRIKVKSPAYVRVHRIKGDTSPTAKHILEMIHSGEHTEFLSYFPEYKEGFDIVWGKLKNYEYHAHKNFERCKGVKRKNIGAVADMMYAGYVYKKLDNEDINPIDYFFSMFMRTQLKFLEVL